MRYLVVASFLGALVVPSAASAQAFGVVTGAPVSRYGGVHPQGVDNSNYYRITVPQPNSEFESYSALATPKTGICKVSGIGKTHNEEDGTETKAAFQNLSAALTARYGGGKVIGFLDADSIWDKHSEWGMSVYKTERTLEEFWSAETGSKLPSGVESLMLSAEAVGPDATYVNLTYEFSNFDACSAIIGNADNSGL